MKFIQIGRWIAGPAVTVILLVLFLKSGILREDVIHYHTGEGSVAYTLSEEENTLTQIFVPAYRNLEEIGFLAEYPEDWEGSLGCLITDARGNVLFEEVLYREDLNNGSFTDLKVSLQVRPGRKYYTILTASSEEKAYPSVGICSKKDKLPEKGLLEDENGELQLTAVFAEGAQLVSRYQYGEVCPTGKALKVFLLCLVTGALISLGLPFSKKIKRGIGVVLIFALPLLLGRSLEMLSFNASMYLPMALKWNLAIMGIMEVVLLLVSHSPGVTVSLSAVVLTLLYSANHYIILFRGTPLRMNDLSAVGTAATVAGGYNYAPTDALARCWLLGFFFLVAGLCTLGGKNKKGEAETGSDAEIPNSRRRLYRAVSYGVSFLVAMLLAGSTWYVFACTDFFQKRGFVDEEYNGFYHDIIYSFDGYLVASFIEIQNSRPVPPSGYDAASVEQLLSKVQQESSPAQKKEELPHIIVVMNESLADLNVLTDLDMTDDNMKFMRSLQENTVKGYTNAAVLGGGTANSEFEMLTGCTTAFFATNYYPYQQAVTRPLHSMVSQLQGYGYRAVSMHPELSTNWNRQKVYRYFGFDESLWKQDFAGAEVIHRGVSDLETYRKIVDIYENREEGEKLFLFDVTMQNHGDYKGNDGPYAIRDLTCNNSSVDQYLSLVKISDEALEELVHYFEKEDEKVVLCIFGDHQPAVASTIVRKYHTGAEENAEEHMKLFKTPFYIWANYDIEEEEGYDISMNYLGGLILDTAGIPLSPYFTYLKQLREEYPIITVNGYVDREGVYHDWNTPDPFDEYRAVQYNYLFDENTISWAY